MRNILLDFTKALGAGLSLLTNEIRDVLPNLYLINQEEDSSLDLISSVDYPAYYPHAYGEYLDRLGSQFGVERQVNEEDEVYRRRIIYAITKNVTVEGLKNSIETLFELDNTQVNVDIIETYKNTFDGVNTSLDSPIRTYRGTQLYGVSIVITPVNLKSNTHNVEDPTGLDPVLDDEGNTITTTGGETTVYNYNDSSGNPAIFNKYRNPYYKTYVDSFVNTSMRDLVYDLISAGVKVERVVIKQPGAGGSKGEIYVN